MSELTELGRVFERVMEHRRIPDEELPGYYRKLCLACEDTGVEGYLHAEHPDYRYMRPCTHCAQGKLVLSAWTKGGGKDGKHEYSAGPYYGMSAGQISGILSRPCAHPPLPPTAAQLRLEESRTNVE